MTTVLLYTAGVVFFVGAILVSIGLHELGHMIPAKKFGGKVTQYFIGFGPTVWSKQVGETEYGVKAIPLGGYVKIVGMLPPGAEELAGPVEHDAQGNEVHKVRKSNTGLFTQLVSDARSAEYETITAADEDRLFYRMPPWKKIVVMAGGPSVNILIAFLLFWTVFGTYGDMSSATVEPAPGRPVVAEVSRCVIPYAEQRLDCREGDPEAPAYEAGLRPGDTVTDFNGTAVGSWDQLRELIRDNAAGQAVIGYERDGEQLVGRTSTTVELRPEDATGEDETLTEVGFLGVSPEAEVVVPTGGPLYTIERMGSLTVDTVQAIATLPVKVFEVGQAIVGVEERQLDSPVSIVGGGRIAGETASTTEVPGGDRAFSLLALVAGFNLFIGVFNFVPLLPLDGGHIAGAAWESVRRRLAWLRRRPDPGYVDVARMLPIAYGFGLVLMVMGVVLIIGDVVAPISLSG